jgi:hypothetical protein
MMDENINVEIQYVSYRGFQQKVVSAFVARAVG